MVGHRIAALCALGSGLASAHVAHAGAGVVEAQGVELSIPDGWSTATKGTATTLSPTKYKGRAIEVIAIKAMPEPTPAALEHLLGGSDKLDIKAAKPGLHDGVKIVAAEGVYVSGKTSLDVAVLVLPVKDHAVIVMSFVKGDSDPAIVKANTDILESARVAGPRLTVEFTAPHTKGLAGAPDGFVKLLTGLAPKMDAIFRFPRALPIKFEECGVVNAFYMPADHSIRICHELFDDLDKLFVSTGMDAKKAAETTANTVLFAFLHEFGHALVGEFKLPITGKGEDAADELAELILTSGKGPEGPKALGAAMLWFDAMAQKKHVMNFANEHSLDQQRGLTIACMLYGSDKARYAPMMRVLKPLGMTDDRLVKCVRDYADRKKAWETLLAAHVVRK